MEQVAKLAGVPIEDPKIVAYIYKKQQIMKNSTITKLRKIIREEISKVKKSRVNEAKLKKVTKQMWAKMDYDQKVNALLSFFKDPDDAEKYGDSDWNDLPNGADGGMYIFE